MNGCSVRVCPYCEVEIPLNGIQSHLIKHRKMFRANDLVCCRFDGRHMVPMPELAYHEQYCKQKESFLQIQVDFGLDDLSAEVQRNGVTSNEMMEPTAEGRKPSYRSSVSEDDEAYFSANPSPALVSNIEKQAIDLIDDLFGNSQNDEIFSAMNNTRSFPKNQMDGNYDLIDLSDNVPALGGMSIAFGVGDVNPPPVRKAQGPTGRGRGRGKKPK